MGNNIFQMLGAIRNPQEFLNKISNNSQMMQNPIVRNTFEMMQKGDNKGLEQMARNLCKEHGMNPDEIYSQVSSMFGNKQLHIGGCAHFKPVTPFVNKSIDIYL